MTKKYYSDDEKIETKIDFSEFYNSKLTQADIKFIENVISAHGNPSLTVVYNSVTQKRGDTNPLIANLVRFVLEIYRNNYRLGWRSGGSLEMWGVPVTRAQASFDRARVIISKLDSEIYFDYID